ncbi:unnamed protein product [Rotaria sp. Silwood1]|nr:unnamed protein product [Rotaria sp. Silwood1]CAF1630065.1 unnamed protein product [Rotaria sp. Silwood1]CAF1631181.1 unnamed protein product [Rotaria sp. Silwood1]CAF3818720.1 unnamed protein product [Rotaria sp. Silwood1]CAF4815286.1 unnamed protein product [Rotaria sp. Silwood1]
MNAIHIIMATSTSANPHNSPNERIENIARKRKISSITFFAFGILLIISGSLLASLESQRFSVSFIIFGIIGLIFAFMYWISAEKILIELRKFNADRMRQAQLQAQNSGAIYLRNINNRDVEDSNPTIHVDLPSYEQSVVPQIEIPPPYDEAIKIKSINTSNDNSNQQLSSIPIHSISLSVDQTINATTTISNEIVNQQQQQQLITNSSS